MKRLRKRFCLLVENMPQKIKKFFTLENIIIFGTLTAAFIVRSFRIGQVLDFNYDQGRDALVIWDLVHLPHKFFLIGPTTGLPGIFRGPYYYYLIAPFYWLGKGNPVYPTIMLILTTVVALWLLYYLGKKIQNKETGTIALIVASFSSYIVYASRWLSNPTPMLPLSMILLWAMIKVTEKKKWAWPVIALVSGLSLFNFGSSGELFYFPAILVLLIWQWKNRPDVKNLILSVILFALTFLPLVFFDLKHGSLLSHNFLGTFGGGSGSFSFPSLNFIRQRLFEYYDIFTNKIFIDRSVYTNSVITLVGLVFLISFRKLIKNKKIAVVLLLLASPFVALFFYRGNYGILYDYYMTGYYLIFVLVFALVLGGIWKYKAGKVFVAAFFILFFLNNIPVVKSKMTNGCDGPQTICLANQKQAINWIYKDAGNKDFNVDAYVPPVIPYSYDYLFKWLGTYKYHKLSIESQVPLLYTLYEVDPPHPERLKAWLDRQAGIGKVVKEQTFGGITVQERIRISK